MKAKLQQDETVIRDHLHCFCVWMFIVQKLVILRIHVDNLEIHFGVS